MTAKSVLDFYRAKTATPRAEHYHHFVPGGHRVLSTEQFFGRTAALARGLEKLGIRRGGRVMLVSDNRPEWHMVDLAVVDATNSGLARYEQVKAFAVLPQMLSIEGGHLTPTLKVKRRVVEKEHADLVDGLYSAE